ncbi:MAG: FHA domain-containing protein [Bradymonadia bacterium]
MSGMLVCPSCSADVAPHHKFCGKCGYPMGDVPRPQAPATAEQPPPEGRARLVLIRGEGLDGVSYHLNAAEHHAGRRTGAILFPEDHYLSPRHANFFYSAGRLMVRDEGSLNGVYIRIRAPIELRDGDQFLAGEELLQVEMSELTGDTVGADNTHFFASPRAARPYRIRQVFEGGRAGLCYMARQDSVVIGREACDLNFPDDRFISGRHCKVDFTRQRVVVTDLQSRNGTYVRVKGERELVNGDYVFLGRQLLRVEFAA